MKTLLFFIVLFAIFNITTKADDNKINKIQSLIEQAQSAPDDETFDSIIYQLTVGFNQEGIDEYRFDYLKEVALNGETLNGRMMALESIKYMGETAAPIVHDLFLMVTYNSYISDKYTNTKNESFSFTLDPAIKAYINLAKDVISYLGKYATSTLIEMYYSDIVFENDSQIERVPTTALKLMTNSINISDQSKNININDFEAQLISSVLTEYFQIKNGEVNSDILKAMKWLEN